jgi:hypothetical protein
VALSDLGARGCGDGGVVGSSDMRTRTLHAGS